MQTQSMHIKQQIESNQELTVLKGGGIYFMHLQFVFFFHWDKVEVEFVTPSGKYFS